LDLRDFLNLGQWYPTQVSNELLGQRQSEGSRFPAQVRQFLFEESQVLHLAGHLFWHIPISPASVYRSATYSSVTREVFLLAI
jgi:hypothetical protein